MRTLSKPPKIRGLFLFLSILCGFLCDGFWLFDPLLAGLCSFVFCSACCGFFSWRQMFSRLLWKIATMFFFSNITPIFFGPFHQRVVARLSTNIFSTSFFVQLHCILHCTSRKLPHFFECFFFTIFPEFWICSLCNLCHSLCKKSDEQCDYQHEK